MKNITIAVDDDTYLAARIAAAEQGTSVSAMVKRFLQEQGESRRSGGVREMPMTYTPQPVSTSAGEEPLPPGAYGRFPDGAPYYTPDGKPRQPGAMRGMLEWTEDFDTWPDGFLEALEEGSPGSVKWWLPDDDSSVDPKR
jgi:hypothetical protein